MNGAGLFTGDWVIVDRGREARHGDIVLQRWTGTGM